MAFSLVRLAICACLIVATTAFTMAPRTARADAGAPSQRAPRHRSCCAFASGLPLHLGSAHVPFALGVIASAGTLGRHSYSGDGAGRELNGMVYTRRGGFIDTGHLREHADATAHLALLLRPVLAAGGGVLQLDPRDADLSLHVSGRVPDAAIASTASLLARRIAFQISIWVEITQHYGHAVIRGAEEMFSAFTPEDLYSNLLGTYLGAAALDSPLPYDRAMDVLMADMFTTLEAVPARETRRIFAALAGHWWRAGVPWPSPELTIMRSFDIGPHVAPLLPPTDVVPPVVPVVLDVPEVDEDGTLLADLYRLEIVPDLYKLPRFTAAKDFPVITAEDLPRLVDIVHRSIDAGEEVRTGPHPVDDRDDGPLAHYLVGLRFLDLNAVGGVAAQPGSAVKGQLGGGVIGIRGDTRGGDFSVVSLDVGHTPERGLFAGFALFRTDALYFCRDPDTHALMAPLLSLLAPCAGGMWLGLSGSIGEAMHDGRTGRTALRPLALYGVINMLGNGQSRSYDDVRLLVRGGGAVEHVWTELEGPTTIPRVAGSALVLLRTPGRTLEAHAAAGYRFDPSDPHDGAFESNLRLRWYFLLGGRRATEKLDGVDPWGVGSLGLQGGYSFWTRPAHSYADVAPPFVSAVHSATWQALLTATLGFEGFTF